MILADESVEIHVVLALRAIGLAVAYVAETNHGATDEAVLEAARTHGAILLTADKDFGELVFRQGRASRGVVLLRLAGVPAGQKAQLVASAFRAHGDELREGFTVVTRSGMRIRRGPGPRNA